ncbi:hypothetical protein FCM35_KLT17025 [Carex littledalei]|uniref:Uncharacterized protein n=1 Tax=Carex littledalei TaxID=544730 RepID=A0A833VWE7_9POAL|nr:hypothetical protein FCM35_KLT17025 [Carex littledalei]
MSLSTFLPRQSEPSDSEDESENEDTIYRIICLENTDYSLASRGGHVVFALTNYFDRYQHWIKDKRHGATIKDSEGQPAFAVINRATGQAISHCPTSQPVPLVPYNMNSCDESVLWTMSKDAYSGGFRYIHRADLISNNWSAVTYTIHDGRNMTLCAPPVVAYGNQPLTWKFVKVSPSSCITLFIPSQHTVKIICQVNVGYNLAIDKDGRTVLLVPSNPKDKYQVFSFTVIIYSYFFKQFLSFVISKSENKEGSTMLVIPLGQYENDISPSIPLGQSGQSLKISRVSYDFGDLFAKYNERIVGDGRGRLTWWDQFLGFD